MVCQGKQCWYWRDRYAEKGLSHVEWSGEKGIGCSAESPRNFILLLGRLSDALCWYCTRLPKISVLLRVTCLALVAVFPAEPLHCVFQHSNSCLFLGFCGTQNYPNFLYHARGASCRTKGIGLGYILLYVAHFKKISTKEGFELLVNQCCHCCYIVNLPWILGLTTHLAPCYTQ